MILVNGYGRMGKLVADEVKEGVVVVEPNSEHWSNKTMQYIQNIQETRVTPSVIVDFSRPQALDGVLPYAVANSVPLVIATTGHTFEQRERIKEAAKQIAIAYCGNFAYGMRRFVESCVFLADKLGPCNVSIRETHHVGKLDAPSGTAILIADALCNLPWIERWSTTECGDGIVHIDSKREGQRLGTHTVVFDLDGERITMTHDALDRRIFAKGALRAADYVRKQRPGLYGMEAIDG